MTEPRYLLCCPLGGLNDRLHQIERCWTYAERWKRTLVIDNGYDLGQSFDFWSVFEEQSPEARTFDMMPADSFRRMRLDDVSVFPACLSGQPVPDLSQMHQDPASLDIYHTESGEKVTFDFSKDYQENVLVHLQFGGGRRSLSMLERLCLTDGVRMEVLSRLVHLPHAYIGIHIRNTDRFTDYKPFLRRLRADLAGRHVLVCSDDETVVRFAETCLSDSTVHATDARRSTDGAPIHHRPDANTDAKHSAILDALTDLAALGRAEHVFAAVPVAGLRRTTLWARLKYESRRLLGRVPLHNGPSGFALLALHLSDHPELCRRFFRA